MAKPYDRPALAIAIATIHSRGDRVTPLAVQKEMRWTDDDHELPGINQELTRNWMSRFCESYKEDGLSGILRQLERRAALVAAGISVCGDPQRTTDWTMLTGAARGTRNGTGSTTVTGYENHTAMFGSPGSIKKPKKKARKTPRKTLTPEQIKEGEMWLARWEVIQQRVENIPVAERAQMYQVSEGTINRYHSSGEGYEFGPKPKYIQYWEKAFHVVVI